MTQKPQASRCRRGFAPRRRAFTLVEVIISVAIGSLLMGGAMSMLSFGTKSFHKTTEHASFRSEAMIVLEKVGKDLDQLVVSPKEVNPLPEANGAYSILTPYVLTGDEIDYSIPDPASDDPDVKLKIDAANGVTFFRYHHLEMATGTGAANEPAAGMPQIIARKVVFETKPHPTVAEAVNLFRNDVQVNKLPLDWVVFHQEPPIVSADQVKGSPAAILTVKIVPKGGMTGHMGFTDRAIRDDVIDRMRNAGALVEKTFHLVGYESMYTNLLYRTLQKVARFHQDSNETAPFDRAYADANFQLAMTNANNPNNRDELGIAIYDHAYIQDQVPAALGADLLYGIGDRASQSFQFPTQVFKLEDEPFVEADANAYADELWSKAISTDGVAAQEEQEAQQQIDDANQAMNNEETP